MEFIGATDYYFWKGVAQAQNNPQLNAETYPDIEFTFNNHTTRACVEAFKWGLSLGSIITKEEYNELTTSPKPNILKVEYINTEENLINTHL
jgi:hypothetical protein